MFDKNAINSDNIVSYIADIFSRRGAQSYMGESVTMAQHMLQTAQEAENAGADPELVVASLLHDIGHYSNEIPDTALMGGTNNYHEEAGANFLAKYFPPSITEPIRAHVAGKRYLCRVDANYLKALSEASIYTLSIQGGPMNDLEVSQFRDNPHWERSLKVRIWDDRGKDPNKLHPDFSHYHRLVESLVLK